MRSISSITSASDRKISWWAATSSWISANTPRLGETTRNPRLPGISSAFLWMSLRSARETSMISPASASCECSSPTSRSLSCSVSVRSTWCTASGVPTTSRWVQPVAEPWRRVQSVWRKMPRRHRSTMCFLRVSAVNRTHRSHSLSRQTSRL